MGRPPPISRGEVEALYRAYGALVRRRARSLLGDDAEAQDALQDVFVRVINAMAEFRRQSQPSTWLYRITTNLCLNRIRDGRRRRERLAEAHEEAPSGIATVPTTTTPEARPLVERVLRDVPADLAEVAVYYYVDEMDQAEIAGLLGVARRTVGYRLERFQEAARAALGDVALPPHVGGQKQGGDLG